MDQISQYQASHKDSINRARELSDSLKEAFERRDELQRQLKDYRSTLEVTKAQRDKLKSAIENREIQNKSSASGLKEKDDKIFRLSRELTSWQSRVPPLVEKFQERDKQARELEAELEAARSRMESFEDMARTNQTRIEPVDAETLPDGLDASNEPHSDTSAHAVSQLEDQIRDADDDDAEMEEEPEAVEEYSASDDDLLLVDEFVEEDDEADEELAAGNDELLTVERRSLGGNSGANGENDDLKQIKGVGPAIEKTLNELGIFRFNQIAEMSEYDIDRVAQRLKGFRSRIYREDWIGQARDLHYQKNNNPS
jgi:predicted flap endonuclease-1-like 5' DNA nuclease